MDFSGNNESRRKIKKWKISVNNTGLDLVFLISVILIAAYGTVMVFSAGAPYATARYHDSYYFVKKQTVWLLLGLATMIVASNIPTRLLKKYALHSYIVTIALLLLVLLVGFVGNGAKRWISIGPLTIQPSEIAKLTLILMLAKYFADFDERATDQRKKKNIFVYGTLIPGLILALPILLVMLQKHLSCIIILGTIGILLMFTAGINPRYLSMFCAGGVGGVAFIALFTDYTKERIVVWQNPELYKLTGGWQTLQGLMAIGTGGIFGVGLGESVLKHCYVSEPANDMIFAILCEELGLVGAATAIILFGVLIVRISHIAMHAEDTFSRLLCLGICIKMAVQVLLNIAVVTNTIPNTGISLPFFSYGGSSLVMLFFEMGIVLSVSKKSNIAK
ncbi:MAG: FtsW/RodA/SpoVE family cell cycle protein [Clostridia bacterium]|nr:FtsW/RodA/SpoVE family cell cycle protein [Clostridia bacterium]